MIRTRPSSPQAPLMKSIYALPLLFGALALSACGDNDGLPGNPDIAPGVVVYGIRGDAELVKFNREAPGTVRSIGTIVVGNGEQVVGLDFRPAGGNLHAITSAGRSLIIDPGTALATAIQPIMGAGTELTGDRFGVDFNPAANALRIIGDDGLNLRVPTAALVSPAPASPVDTLVDGRMGVLQGVTAAAYTFPLAAPAAPTPATTLFVIDTESDQLFTQDANVGRLTSVGALGVDASAANGYDIVQVGSANEHYALLTVGATTSLYSLNTATGAATALGALPADTYRGLIVETVEAQPNQRVVSALAESGTDYAVVSRLLDTATGTLTDDGEFPIANLPAGESLIGMDVRTTPMEPGVPVQAYAVSLSGRIYSLQEVEVGGQLVSLSAVQVAMLSFPPAPAPQALAGTSFGVDFNPRADLLRIVSNTGQNLRVNLQAGRVIADAPRAAGFAFVDGTTRLVAPAPQIVATAYRAAPAMGTFQFALDARDSSLYRVAVPNDGALVRVGPLGVTLDPTAEHSLDISGTADANVLAALRVAGQGRSTLYSVNLDTGAATSLGVIGRAGPVNAVTSRTEN